MPRNRCYPVLNHAEFQIALAGPPGRFPAPRLALLTWLYAVALLDPLVHVNRRARS